MMTRETRNPCSVIVSLFIMIFLLHGCGYSIYGYRSLPFTEIQIGSILNKTLEPKLQDKLHKALVEEFSKNGITVNPSAKLKLTGVINEFELIGLSEKDEITIEYSVAINADFKVIDEKGDLKEIRKISSPFIVSFTASKDLGGLMATKDIAEERALSDIATRLVGSLIYR
ncbi:MAG: LPS assembly lipoprotein LptE [Nitrospirota bacterium]